MAFKGSQVGRPHGRENRWDLSKIYGKFLLETPKKVKVNIKERWGKELSKKKLKNFLDYLAKGEGWFWRRRRRGKEVNIISLF